MFIGCIMWAKDWCVGTAGWLPPPCGILWQGYTHFLLPRYIRKGTPAEGWIWEPSTLNSQGRKLESWGSLLCTQLWIRKSSLEKLEVETGLSGLISWLHLWEDWCLHFNSLQYVINPHPQTPFSLRQEPWWGSEEERQLSLRVLSLLSEKWSIRGWQINKGNLSPFLESVWLTGRQWCSAWVVPGSLAPSPLLRNYKQICLMH